MIRYRHYLPPQAAIAGSATASVFASLLFAQPGKKHTGRRKAPLDDWENEGGGLAAPTPTSFNMETRT
jgi:hypothetical protein